MDIPLSVLMAEKHTPEVLGIIGARSGSQGVPHKNIRLLAGVPLLGRIIDTAKRSKYITRLIVSTDSEEYAAVARAHGAETPFLRPAEFATASSPDFEFIEHALKWLEKYENYKPDVVVRCVATVPLQMTEDIDACIEEVLNDPTADGAVVIAPASQHPAKAMKIVMGEDGRERLVGYLSGEGKDTSPSNRQGYEKAYVRSNVTVARRDTILKKRSLTGDIVRFHIIPQDRSFDIDSEVDFLILEYLIETFGDGTPFKY